MCQPGASTLACGAQGNSCQVCSLNQTCSMLGTCQNPVATDAGLDAGQRDAGAPSDAGTDAGLDAGSDAGADAGDTCGPGLLFNGEFDCALQGWVTTAGTAAIFTQDVYSGIAAVKLSTDSTGAAQLSSIRPIKVDHDSVFCLKVYARGTVPSLRIEARITPINMTTAFDTPVSSDWVGIPVVTWLKIDHVPKDNEVTVIVKATTADAGQTLDLDGLQVVDAPNNICP